MAVVRTGEARYIGDKTDEGHLLLQLAVVVDGDVPPATVQEVNELHVVLFLLGRFPVPSVPGTEDLHEVVAGVRGHAVPTTVDANAGASGQCVVELD